MNLVDCHAGGYNNIDNYTSHKTIDNFSIAYYHFTNNGKTVLPFSHSHLAYEFIIPIKTVPLLIYDKANYIGEVGYVYPVNPNVIHGIEFPLNESEVIDIVCDMDYFDNLKKELGFDKEYFYTRFTMNYSFVELCKSFINNSNSSNDKNISNLICDMLIETGLSDKTDRRRPEKKYAKNIKNIIIYMYDNFRDCSLTIEKLATLSGYSTTYFTKAFKAYMNDSPIVHLNKIRISEAKALMITKKTLKFKEISEMVGFDNLSTFTESFKRVTGYTPKDFKSKYIDEAAI